MAKLCSVCSKIDIHSMLPSDRIGEENVPLGTLLDIFKKADECALCGLATEATRRTWLLDIVDYGPELDLSKTDVTLFTAHGGSVTSPEPASILRLQYSFRPAEVYAAMEVVSADLTPPLQVMQESALKLALSPQYYGRVIKDTVDLNLVREWLRICEHTHGETCESDWWRGKGEEDRLPSTARVMDVQDMMIVPIPHMCRYVALSYLWGADIGGSYWTSKSNLIERSRPHGLSMSVLPTTITDVILLTRLLGERYLWVDALCIVQDDPADKVIQIGIMERIYGLASLTVFAAGGNTAYAPLPGLREGTRKVNQRIENIQGLLISAALPYPREAVRQTTWNTRGWTYQEIALSRRRLIFTPMQVYFECCTDVWAEDFAAESEGQKPQHRFITYQARPTFASRRGVSGNDNWKASYMRFVREYTIRHLTNEMDIVDAFTALTNAMARGLQLSNGDLKKAFCFAMPSEALETMLLWQPDCETPCTRRIIVDVNKDREPSAPYPSWAWAGWRGRILYAGDAQFRDIRDTNDTPHIDGSIVDRWFLVDDKGNFVDLDVKHTKHLIVLNPEQSRPLPLIPWIQDWDQEHACVSTGALVFRTSTAYFTVVYPQETDDNSELIGRHHCVFTVMTVEDKPRLAGQVILPNTYPTSTTLQFAVICRGAKSMSQRNDKAFSGLPLYVMALSKQSVTGMTERVGLGIINEDAWMQADHKVEVVIVG